MPPWIAEFIAADEPFSGAPVLSTTFALERGHGAVDRATLALSALGVVEASLNGAPVAADVLTPGWSSYEWRVRYAEHDVTSLLRDTSTIDLALGNGWYRGRLGWGDGVPAYGDELAGFAQLTIRFADGHEQIVATDSSWVSRASAVTENDLYDGQSIDARLADTASPREGGEQAGVHVVPGARERLEPYVGPPIRRQEEREPVAVLTSPSGATILDFGQNLVGWVRLEVSGERGATITLRHAEVLEDGELGVRPLRTAKATDRFTLSGGRDVFEPSMTFHGFRYVEVDGWPASAGSVVDGLRAIVIGSQLRRTGTFRCSDPLVQQLHDNVVWGLRGNFVDVPTDCPQRDERLGWTGDIAVFAPAAAYLYDVQAFLRDWLRDLVLEQAANDGIVPFVVPDVLKRAGVVPGMPPIDSTAIWGDAVAWVPWALWRAHGDPAVLEETFDATLAHVRRVRAQLSAEGLWDTVFQFGDWLDPDSDPAQPWMAKADPGVVATASAFRTATIAAQMADVVHRDAEHQELAAHAAALRAAFRASYVADERIRSDCTTVYALAIVFGLLDDAELGWAGRRLADLVAASGDRISTGFAGTPYILDALSSTGQLATAYRLLMQRESPSWLYPVTMGATTIWERWDSMLPDGSINPGEMTSFNHYALGAVADWLHRVVGGIAPLDPGYARILMAPQPGGGLAWAESTLETPHGSSALRWSRTDGVLELRAVVPEGTTAILRLDGHADELLDAGVHSLSR